MTVDHAFERLVQLPFACFAFVWRTDINMLKQWEWYTDKAFVTRSAPLKQKWTRLNHRNLRYRITMLTSDCLNKLIPKPSNTPFLSWRGSTTLTKRRRARPSTPRTFAR